MNYCPSCNIVSHDHPEFANIVGTYREDCPERPQRAPKQEDPDDADIDHVDRIARLLTHISVSSTDPDVVRAVGKLAISLAARDCSIRDAIHFDPPTWSLLLSHHISETSI